MKLEALKVEKLKKIPLSLNWGEGYFKKERFFYCDEAYFYKIWSRRYRVHSLEVRSGRWRERQFINQENRLALIDCGLANAKTCPALVDLIVDVKNFCRGYVLKKGSPLQNNGQIGKRFLETIWTSTLQCGYASTDFTAPNVIRLENGRLSLTDLDTPPTSIYEVDLEFERKKGSLREHVHSEYKARLELLFEEIKAGGSSER